MHILVFTHYFPPEVNAPASRLFDLARLWVAAGHRVTVVTAAPSHPAGKVYPGYENRLFARETIAGIDVIRVWTWLAANEGFALRIINYVSYFLSVAVQGFRLPAADVVISSSPQFFCGLAGRMFQRRHRPWVLEIRDLWPESIVTVGAVKRGRLIRMLEAIEAWAYRRADRVVAVTDSFVPFIAARRGTSEGIAVIKNGANLDFYDPAAAADRGRELREELGLGDRFVAAYVGTHGMAQGLGAVLDAAERTRDRDDIVYLFVGDGAERRDLVAAAEARALTNVRIVGQRPKSDMPGIWSLTGASLVVLRKSDTFKSVLPSKMFEAMAMRRPIILGVEGEAKALLDASGGGVAVTPESGAEIAAAVLAMASDPALAMTLGNAGRAYVATHFNRESLANRYADVLAGAIAEKQLAPR